MKSFLFFFLLLGTTVSAQQNDTTAVYFAYNSDELDPGARATLDQWLEANRQAASAMKLTLTGHCDARGSLDYNDALAGRRIRSVKEYLLGKGLPAAAISTTKSYGERQPLNSNSTEEEMQQNRRVELIRTDLVVTPPPPPRRQDTTSFSQKELETATVGQTFRLRNINFYGGRHTFLPQSMPALEELLSIMKSNPKLKIEIRGHICCRPGDSNDGDDFDSGDRRLSHNRARAVFDYLVENGIDAKRMTYRGFAGTEMLVYPEYTDADRTLNRRVEIRITGK